MYYSAAEIFGHIELPEAVPVNLAKTVILLIIEGIRFSCDVGESGSEVEVDGREGDQGEKRLQKEQVKMEKRIIQIKWHQGMIHS